MEQAGRPVPDTYKNAPELNILTIPFWKAFTELTTSRDMGFGIGYIKYSEVSSWLSENYIFDMEERALFRRIISFIDSMYVSEQSKKSENNKQKSKTAVKHPAKK